MHRSYREIGNRLTNDWGFDDNESLDTTIRSMKDDRRSTCILAAILDELRNIREEMQYATSRQPSNNKHPVSDGMFAAIKTSTDTRLPIDVSRLSIRASNILDQAGIMYVSEITWERLTKMKGCGPTIATEIINWANSLIQTAAKESSCEN